MVSFLPVISLHFPLYPYKKTWFFAVLQLVLLLPSAVQPPEILPGQPSEVPVTLLKSDPPQ